MSVQLEWVWNKIYWEIYNKANVLIKVDASMKFYNKRDPLYLETEASRVGLGAGLLWVTDGLNCPKDTTPDNTILQPIVFASNSLSSVETHYSNIERESFAFYIT